MEVFVFARFHARPGHEGAVADALRDVVAPTREEPGCVDIHAFRSIRDPRLFYVHSRWKDEAAFERHATLAHTVRFLERVEALIDHALEVTRAERIG
jgi:quinol monooxygenase YgiN